MTITHNKLELHVKRGTAQPHELKTIVGDECFHFESISGHNRLVTCWYRTSSNLILAIPYKFFIFASGEPVTEVHKLKFLDTVVGPVYVWHIYRELFDWEVTDRAARKKQYNMDTGDVAQ